MAGLFFCLAFDTVQGFYFARIQYSHAQAFTTAFIPSMQSYTANATKQCTGLYRGVSGNLTHSTAHDTRPAQAVIIPPAPRWSVSQHRSTSSAYQDTNAPPGRCTGQHSHPIIIRYIRVQHTADHASPAGSAPPPV